MAGRGWGKTRVGAELIRRWEEEGADRIALVGETPAEVRDVQVEGVSGLLAVCPPWRRPRYEPTKRRLVWPRRRDDWIVHNGGIAHVYSGNNPDQLRGPQHEKAWVDELAKYPYAREVWTNLLFGLRDAESPQIVNTTTPRPIKLLKDILERKSTVLSTGSTYENRDNLTPVYYEEVIEPLEGTELAAQEIHARLLDEARDAYWTRKTLEETRIAAPDDLESKLRILEDLGVELDRVAVAIDPATTSKKTSNETGIVAGALGRIDKVRHGFALGDVSGRFSPAGWAGRAIAIGEELERLTQLEAIYVYETNQGGDMVRHTLTGEKSDLTLRDVHASKGKEARAQPVSLKQEKGVVHLVGLYPVLEDQLCTWVPGAESPDRLDAYVWLFTYLLIGPKQIDRPLLPRIMRE